MNQRPNRRERLFAVFIIGVILLNFPLVKLFSRDGLIAGIPIFYFYLFVTWLALIILAARLGRRS